MLCDITISSNLNYHRVEFIEVLASKTKIYLVLELVTGGELFGLLVKERGFLLSPLPRVQNNTPFWFVSRVTHVNTVTAIVPAGTIGGRALPAMTPLSSHSPARVV
jgi:hypothetical protein